MKIRNQPDRPVLPRARTQRTLIIAAISFAFASGVALADATISMPPEREAGLVVIAKEATLFSLLDDLATRTGMVIKGRRHISDRQINGNYEGDMLVVLKALLKNESYMVILGPEIDKGYTPVEKIVFTGQSERGPVRQAVPVATPPPDVPRAEKVQPQKPGTETLEPMRSAPQIHRNETSPPLPPIPAQIDARILRAISRPSSDTPEGKRFDAALNKLQNELDQKLSPLKNLR